MAKLDDKKLRKERILDCTRCELPLELLSLTLASPMMEVKPAIATRVPKQNPPKYNEAVTAEGIVSAGITPTKWPVPVNP
eukprot:CAMPEP_0117886308 /NCGR_PEP_ID=MMETSP0950-20121206/20260_1 /TAXON_ID=44440 /ORGANISM="Chattonella subsalsa, Strain CCMP2191" /LENGTH=79 /DNA_ID=CAMNT_0005743565 /DNA_START=181 /DNA_END=420 /DNA_ORIENTATION=+